MSFQRSIDLIRQLLERVVAPGIEAEQAELKAACERSVVEWRWATECMEPFNPHDSRVLAAPRPRWLKTEPKEYGTRHGLDRNGQIQIAYVYQQSHNDPPYDPHFYVYEPTGFSMVLFKLNEGELQRHIAWHEFEEDRWIRTLNVSFERSIEQELTWRDGKLLSYTRRFWQN